MLCLDLPELSVHAGRAFESKVEGTFEMAKRQAQHTSYACVRVQTCVMLLWQRESMRP